MIFVYFLGTNFPAEFPGLAAKLPLRCIVTPAEGLQAKLSPPGKLKVVITGDG